jgi:restriction system protein
MPVPTYDQLMFPLLQFAGDRKEHHIREAIEALANYLDLSEDERSELLPSGKQRKLDNRVQWAKVYIKKARLVESTGRGLFRITDRGISVLNGGVENLDNEYLKHFPEFVDFITPTRSSDDFTPEDLPLIDHSKTPKELIDSVFQGIRVELADELLEYVLAASPVFFEKLVVDLLVGMGYGSTLETAGRRIGRTGDGGLDGYIQEDKLGLDMIYLQAKRWAPDNVVGRPEVQGFAGSLIGAGATKGVFLTTSRFSQQARDYAQAIPNMKIILIDGQQLAQLMIEHDVGVSVEKHYIVKKVDSDYFDLG